MIVGPEETPRQDDRARPRFSGGRLGIVALVVLVIVVGGLLIGGEAAAFVEQGYRVLPFVPLAVLAYLGLYHTWARTLAVLWLAGLVFVIAALATGSAIGALSVGLPLGAPGGLELDAADLSRVALVMGGMLAAAAVGALGFLRSVRRLAARYLPLDPDSFVHTIALVTVVTLTLESFVPLIILGEPPLITLLSGVITGVGDVNLGDRGGVLRGEIYGLIWLVPGAIMAVGYGIRRDLEQALRRLGLVRVTGGQAATGVALGVGLVLLVAVLGLVIEWLWELMGWETTGGAGFDQAFGTLLAPFMTPIGAVVLGLSAGLGEELAVRGVLQPRLGILLSNLLFTSLHAFQYNWDALVVVFLLGAVLGLIRRRTNTATSVIVHGVYDFVLVLAMMAEMPVVGE
ncbi:MAG: CPBP family intramembrane metalloprotease [Anaerolineae bacterium]|nr:CPBP family intramembrane metalloprotease [Anaerolineae bacterium]